MASIVNDLFLAVGGGGGLVCRCRFVSLQHGHISPSLSRLVCNDVLKCETRSYVTRLAL